MYGNVDTQGKGNGDFTVGMFYPRVEGNSDSIVIDLYDVRAAQSIKIEFSHERNGWVITQLIDSIGMTGYEVAFIDAWRDE